MNKSDLQRMFDYHYWAHRLVWNCVTKLTDEQYEQDLEYSIGSLQRQYAHVIAVERMWLSLVQGTLLEDRTQWLNPMSLTDRAKIRAAWDALEMDTRNYLSTVEDETLNAVIEYEFSWCGKQRHPRWQAMMYIVTHAVDHRAQILAGIHRLGGETVMQDFIRFVWGLES